MAKGKEFKVGLFAVLMAGALYVGFNYLRGLDVFSPLNTYYAVYKNVSGLNKGDRVILNGLEVGSVVERQFIDQHYDEIMVTMAIDKTIVITDSTMAKLAKPDFLGALEVQLVMKSGGNRVLQSGDTLIAAVDRGITELLTEEGLSAANSLSALVNKINDVLDPFVDKADTISLAIDNFKYFSDELVLVTRDARSSLEQIKLKLDYTADSLVAVMGGIKPLLEEYQKLGVKLNAVDVESRLQKMDSVLLSTQAFVDRLNSNEGTYGKLMSNDSLYDNLTRTMADLDSLFIDLRYNPKRYIHFSVFGRKNRPPADGREISTKRKKK